MTIQWPGESESSSKHSLEDHSINLNDSLHRLVDTSSSGVPVKFKQTTAWIARRGDDISTLEQKVSAVCSELELTESPEIINLLMTWACAEALAENPTLRTWQHVRNLKSHSWHLDNWLSSAMLVCAEKKSGTNDAYIALAKEIFKAINGNTLKSQFDSINNDRENFQAAWRESNAKLEEIWWGLRHWNLRNYAEACPIFEVLGALDPQGFMDTVSQSNNPYLVNSAIFASGGFGKFYLWEKFALTAPSAFSANGNWNESVTLPLLLVLARDQLLQAGGHIPFCDSEDTKSEQELSRLTEAVIKTLAKRQDALPLFARWSTWLMRQLLMHGIKDAFDVHSSASVDAALIKAIGRELSGKAIIPESPPDAPAWEKWCYQCVLSFHANNGFISPPEYQTFLKEWAITLDDWTNERGRQLREHASLIVTITKTTPGDAIHLLAYPIAISDSPVDAWIELWDATQTLREIAEFGAGDGLGSKGYESRAEAGRLLFLVFCIGLATLDQRASQCSAGNSSQARDLAKLYKALALAVREMRELDDTLNMEKWLQAVHHLATRRLIWEDRGDQARTDGQFPVFLKEDKPTFSDYLRASKNDVMELLAILHTTLINEPNRQIILKKLQEASIDLSNAIATAKQLNNISVRRYPFDESQLSPLVVGVT